ncbi:hypothetical protein KC351_g10743, partial [Hortaea werneckii]
MTTPFASNTIRSAHRCLSAANPIRPTYTSSIIPQHHQPFHTRATATTAFAQAQWNHRRRTPPRPSPINHHHHHPNQPLDKTHPFTTTTP